jgi:hypothetical protein
MAFERTAGGFDRTAGGHRFDFSRGICVLCGITRKEFEDEERPQCTGAPYENPKRVANAPDDHPPEAA